jgi:hypothetical protein
MVISDLLTDAMINISNINRPEMQPYGDFRLLSFLEKWKLAAVARLITRRSAIARLGDAFGRFSLSE